MERKKLYPTLREYEQQKKYLAMCNPGEYCSYIQNARKINKQVTRDINQLAVQIVEQSAKTKIANSDSKKNR
jgi:hypothetical protein